MKKEKQIRELINRVFEKAKNASSKDSPYGLCKYLHEEEKVHSSERNLTRYYNYFIDGKKEEKIKPDDATLDELSQYLGNENFKGFTNDLEKSEADTTLQHKIKILKNRLSLSIIIIVLLSISLTFYLAGYYEKNCMVWVNDHYEPVKCSGAENESKRDNIVLSNLKQINNPMECLRDMWYDKTDNKVTFFTHHGKHPVNGKILKPVTEHICEKYILEIRDSIMRNTTKDSIQSR
ncbi:MAG: hypothetical protein ACX93O_15830 [Flagellimonas sp.]